MLFFKRKWIFKNSSWGLGFSSKALSATIVKKEESPIWSSDHIHSVKPGQNSAFMLSPHPFRTQLHYQESLNFCNEGHHSKKQESFKSSISSSCFSCTNHQIGKKHQNSENLAETTVFLVDPRGHFSPKLNIQPPYPKMPTTPSNASSVSNRSLHYGFAYSSKVKGLISRSHSVLTFESPTKVCIPVQRASSLSDKSVTLFRCGECHALCERNRKASINGGGLFGQSASLLPDSMQVEMPINMTKDKYKNSTLQ